MVCFNEVLENLMRECYILHFSLSLSLSDSQLEAPVQELSPLKFKDLPIIKMHDLGLLHQLMNGMVNQAKASLRLIWNSFEELEQAVLTILLRDFYIPISAIYMSIS
jgi:hypothetical protein